MKSLLNKKSGLVSVLMATLLLLSGCGGFRSMMSGDDSIDYKSVVRTEPLSIPPDMTQAASDPRYRSAGTATFSQYQQAQTGGKGAPNSAQSGVLPTRSDMRVMRDGELRWLSVEMPPEKVFSMTADFWTDAGFTLDVTDPKAGLIVTNWAENRAKIPESWLRQALGSLLDSVYDSGTRDRFRTRIERVGSRTEVYISHRHMEEISRITLSDVDVRWTNAKEDPGLNAAMLARLMVYLGEDVDGARRKMAQSAPGAQEPTVSTAAGDKTMLLVAEPFDRAWRRVGVALDSGGFTVDDRDRNAGDFYVRYVDTDTGEKREEPGFFARMFGTKDPAKAPTLRIHLVQQGDQTQVTVLDAQGARDNSPTAQRLLSVLSGKM
ncbi:MAG: outer membrane protein assembly factor BamC [Alcaligenaceae bacterium]